MSEPSTNVPGEVADTQVELELDEDKIEAWDEVKSDYQVDPDAKDTPAGADGSGMEAENAPG